MRKKKSIAVLAVIFTIALSSIISASALGLQHVEIKNGLTYNSIRAGFLESQKGSGNYGTDKNKIIKQCYVRLQEGDYDSGRSYSEEGVMYNGSKYIWSPTESKGNNPLKTCYTYYGWFYF